MITIFQDIWASFIKIKTSCISRSCPIAWAKRKFPTVLKTAKDVAALPWRNTESPSLNVLHRKRIAWMHSCIRIPRLPASTMKFSDAISSRAPVRCGFTSWGCFWGDIRNLLLAHTDSQIIRQIKPESYLVQKLGF